MLAFTIVDARDDNPLCEFEAPWAVSLPIFREVAAGYFQAVPTAARLLFYAAPDSDGPWALVCRADRAPTCPHGVELTAGPLLLAAVPSVLH